MAFEPIYTPNNTENLGTKYQRIDDNFNQITTETPITTDQLLYITTSGSDTTGDGTIANPYQTVIGALTPIANRKLTGVTLTLFFNEAGTYQFGDAERDLLGSLLYSQCKIQIEGIEQVVNQDNAVVEQTLNQMYYDVTNSGLTVVENELRGKYISDGTRNYPISYNSAGTNTYELEFMRGSRNGTYDVIEVGVILDMSTGSEDDFLQWDFIGLPSIEFKRVVIDLSGNTIDLSRLKAALIFDFGTTIKCSELLFGQFSDHTITNVNFTGCVIELSTLGVGINPRNSLGKYSFTRCLILHLNNTLTKTIELGSNSAIELRETCIIGGGSSSVAIAPTRFAALLVSKAVILREFKSAISYDYAGGRVLSNLDQGYAYFIMKGVNYTVEQVYNNVQLDLFGVVTGIGFIEHLNNVTTPIDRDRGIRLYIDGVVLEPFQQLNKSIVPKSNALTYASTLVVDCNDGNVQGVTLTGDVNNFSLINAKPGGSYTLFIRQDGVGGREVSDLTTGTKTDNSLNYNSSLSVNILNIVVDDLGNVAWSYVEQLT